MIERTINFTISIETDNKIKKYARYVNLQKPTCIRFFLSEQIVNYNLQKTKFEKQWKTRRYKKLDNSELYGNHSVNYSFKVSNEMYEDLQKIKEKLQVSLNELVSNMIQNEMESIFADYDKKNATLLKHIKQKEHRSNIHCSNVMKQDLNNIADVMGISLNALISHILMKYLIEHYNDYFDGQYIDENGKFYTGGL